MLGRATPSPQLEQAASYVADQFRRFGLRQGGDNGGYQQRYKVSQHVVDTAASAIRIAGAAPATLKPGLDVYLLRFAPLPTHEVSGPVVLFAGTPDSTNPLAGADVRSEEHTSELQSQSNLVCRLLLEKKKKNVTLS